MGSFDRSNDERKDSFPGYKGAGMPKPPVPPPPSMSKPAGTPAWSDADKSWHADSSKDGSQSKSDDAPWRWNKYGSSGSGSSGASSSGSWKWNKYASSGSSGSTGESMSAGFVRPSESKSSSGKFSSIDPTGASSAGSGLGSSEFKGSLGSGSSATSSASSSAAKEDEAPWRWNKYASSSDGSSSPSSGTPWKWNKYTSSWTDASKSEAKGVSSDAKSAAAGSASGGSSADSDKRSAGNVPSSGASSAATSGSGWGSGFHSGNSKSGSSADASHASDSDKGAFSWGSGFHSGGSHDGSSAGATGAAGGASASDTRSGSRWGDSKSSSTVGSSGATKGIAIGDVTYGAHTKSHAGNAPKTDAAEEAPWRWNKYGNSKGDASAKQGDDSWRWNKYAGSSSEPASAMSASGDVASSSAMASKEAAEKRSESPWGWAKDKNLHGASASTAAATAASAGATAAHEASSTTGAAGSSVSKTDGKIGSYKAEGMKIESEPKPGRPVASSSSDVSKDATPKREQSSWHSYTPGSGAAGGESTGAARTGAHSSMSDKLADKSADKPMDNPADQASGGKEGAEEGSLREDFERRYDKIFGRTPSSSSRAKASKDSRWYASSADGKSDAGEPGSVPAEDFYKPSKYFDHKDYLDPDKRAESPSSRYSASGSGYSAMRRGARADQQRADSRMPRSSQDGRTASSYGSGEDYTSHAGASSHGVPSNMYGAKSSYSSRYEAARQDRAAQGHEHAAYRAGAAGAAGAAAAGTAAAAAAQGAQQPSSASVTSPQARQKPQEAPQLTPAQAARQRVATQQSQAAAQAQAEMHQGASATQQAPGQEAPSRSEVSTYDTSFYGTKSFKRPRKNHKRRNIILGVVGVLIIAVAVYGFALYTQVKDAKADASIMMSQSKTLVDQLKTGDKSAATQTALDLTDTAQKLNGTVNGPLWAPATLIPVYGGDVAQVRTIAGVADTLCTQVLMPLVNSMPAGGMSEFFEDGGINVSAIENVLVPLSEESDTIQACADQVNGLGETHLAQLQEPVEKVKDLVGQLGTLSKFAGELSDVLPAMLGVDEPRYYLLAAMNNSELRSGGGMVGSVGVMTVTDGKLEIGDFVAAGSLARPEDGYMPVSLTGEEVRIFNTRIGTDIRDTALMPDFPRAAELEKGLWEYSGNQSVSGVIAVDPVFLQRLLALTGSVTTSDGTVVDGSNAGEMLMYEVYLKYRDQNEVQDAFFAEVAHAAFANIFGNLGDVDFAKFIKVITTSFKDRRINVWMANPEEEAIILELGAAGDVSRSETDPATGIFFGGASGGKNFWFLDVDTQVGEGNKNADGSMSYDITVTFHNTLTDDVAEGLPHYFWGDIDVAKQSKAQMDLYVYLFAPGGGTITNMTTEGYFFQGGYQGDGWYLSLGDSPMLQTTYNGGEVWYGVARVEPSSTSAITYTVTTSPKAEHALEVNVTPIANENL